MGLKQQFKTDADLEKQGIVIDYGEARIRIARAGGANQKFAKRLEAVTKPYKRAIQTETMDTQKGNELLQQVYAETVVLDWETKTGENDRGEAIFETGIDPEDAGEDPEADGSLLAVNSENILKVFKNLPDLFQDLQEQAQKSALFRQEIMEADAGN